MGAIDYTWLEQYGRISTSPASDPIYTTVLASLRDAEHAKEMLTVYHEYLRADCLRTTAVYFMHSIRGLLLAIHYMNAMCDTILNISLDNLQLQLVVQDGYPSFQFLLLDQSEYAHPAAVVKDQSESKAASVSAREAMLNAYYKEQLRPLIEGIAQAVGANTGQMWAQQASILKWFKTLAAQMDITAEEREAVHQGYEYVTMMPPEILGLRKNVLAFKPVEIDSPYQPGEKMLMKSACCLHYKVYDGQEYCYSCPKLSRAERQSQYDKIRASR
ncbi:hypothetical protein PAECIP112173_03053 [Paenibacillus sp. JJ-100]|uniref:(2Fe-2S)-binding protein n=1 Tax=Paenibacillus sp. JJ-100 TaxID=2974896 RepID=UPI0022FF7DC8|nr:(2Fe-2S)-binding protein [Paenibacillus sp. JJ-100]CAI6080929.1 hypothetical protein PAECIP112173_03053 [Paenibacillus sp. JJ-100]